MKRVCLNCQRVISDPNLWCTEKGCGRFANLFSQGEYVGDIEILSPLQTFRTSTIYAARRDQKKILVKIAHPECEKRLQQEAQLFARHRGRPSLPTLLPAQHYASLRRSPFGHMVVHGERIYYSVFKWTPCESLRQLLMRNSIPWHQHSAWFIIGLGNLLAQIHRKYGVLNLSLTPESVFVRTDRRGIPRPLLLDLGALAHQGLPNGFTPSWAYHPAYTAPEVRYGHYRPSISADIFGLGLLLYEMLEGGAAFDNTTGESYKPLQRNDLNTFETLHKALNFDPTQRHRDLLEVTQELRSSFGAVPPEHLFPRLWT